MWKNYVEVIRERAGNAVHILDRYHIMARMNKAIDEVRAGEARKLKQAGREPILKHSRWCLLKNPANLTDRQVTKLSELIQYNLASIRAYLLREDFQRFWTYQSPVWLRTSWINGSHAHCAHAWNHEARSGTLRRHRQLSSTGPCQRSHLSGNRGGLQQQGEIDHEKIVWISHNDGIVIALYHALGELPEPKLAHEFC